MDLRILRYFLAIVEERSITGAAEYLMISQPSLSRQIRELEQRLGQKLFERGSRTITLTPAGELLRERAEEIVALADRAERELASLDRPLGGPVYVGAGETAAMRYLVRAMRDVAQEHPQVRFHVYSGDSEDVVAKLDARLLDFALVFEPFDGSKYSWIPVPARDVWGLIMRRDDPLAAKEGVTVEDLKSTPLILSRQTRVDRQFGVWGDGLNEGMLHVVGTYNLLNRRRHGGRGAGLRPGARRHHQRQRRQSAHLPTARTALRRRPVRDLEADPSLLPSGRCFPRRPARPSRRVGAGRAGRGHSTQPQDSRGISRVSSSWRSGVSSGWRAACSTQSAMACAFCCTTVREGQV